MKYTLCVFAFFVGCKAECKLGGNEDVNVNVDCVVKRGPQVDCDVKQTKGTSEVEACWDFSATCANGAQLKAERACQKIKDGGTTTTTIPTAKLTITGPECEGMPTAKLEHLTINGKTPNK